MLEFKTKISSDQIEVINRQGIACDLKPINIEIHWLFIIDNKHDYIESFATLITKISGQLIDSHEKVEMDLENWTSEVNDKMVLSIKDIRPKSVVIDIEQKIIKVE